MTLWTAIRLRWHARRAIHYLKALEKAASTPGACVAQARAMTMRPGSILMRRAKLT